MPARRLADLFCGAGGAGKGFADLGFEVVGVDIAPQPNYPFEFHQADALSFDLSGFDAVHASPPCQAHTPLKVMSNARVHEDLIEQTRELLQASGLPWVIENVEGAPLRSPVRLCSSFFGLGAGGYQLHRHRRFESNFALMSTPCHHRRGHVLGVYGDHARTARRSKRLGEGQLSAADGLRLASEAMEIDWMTWRELTQAIPPAYTRYIGTYLLNHLAEHEQVAA
jgi:DNA (cytosine-5)-methyltransferase 1